MKGSRIGDLLVVPNTRDGEGARVGNKDATELFRSLACRLLTFSRHQSWHGYRSRIYETPRFRAVVLSDDTSNVEAVGVTGCDELLDSARSWTGRFLLVAEDNASGEWVVMTDRFGTIHCYVGRSVKSWALGTSFFAVRAAIGSERLDWESIAGFCAWGFFMGDRTYDPTVKILRPASIYRFSPGGESLGQLRYWNWPATANEKISFDDAVDRFASTFGTVMEEQTSVGRVALPISGGLDSRSTLVPLPQHANVWAYSYGYAKDSIEIRIANELAQLKELDFHAFVIQPYLLDRLSDITAWTEGFQDITQPRQVFILDDLKASANAVIAAHWGDVWMDASLKSHELESLDRASRGGGEATASEFRRLANVKFRKPSEWLLENLIQPQLPGVDLHELLENQLGLEIRLLDGIEDHQLRVKALKTDNWSFRWTLSSLRTFQSAVDVRLPFYDTRVVDTLIRLPADCLSGRRLQVAYIKRHGSGLANVEWQGTGRNLHGEKMASGFRRLVSKFGRGAARFVGTGTVERNWEAQFLSAHDMHFLSNVLLKPLSMGNWHVDRHDVESLLDTFRASVYKPSLLMKTRANGVVQRRQLGYVVPMFLTLVSFFELTER